MRVCVGMCVYMYVSVYVCVPVGIGRMVFNPDANTHPCPRSGPSVQDVCPVHTVPYSNYCSNHLRLVLGSASSDLDKF